MLQCPHSLPILIDGNGSVDRDLTNHELAVAEIANLAARFLAIGVYTTTGEHSLLIQAILTIIHATELAEPDTRVVFEDHVTARGTSTSPGFFAVRTVQEEDGIFIAVVELVTSNSYLFVSSRKSLQFSSETLKFLLKLHLCFKSL